MLDIQSFHGAKLKTMKVLCNSVGKHEECENCGASKFHENSVCEPCPFIKNAKCEEFDNKFSYTLKHKPTGENWVVLGFSFDRNRICAAGWPPSMAHLSDCVMIEKFKKLDEKDIQHKKKEFGHNWD